MNNNRYQPIDNRQRGVGLVEIMLALALGLLLTGGLINIFLANKQSYTFNQGLSRLQENSRFALEALTRDLQKADYRNMPTDARFVPQGSDTYHNFVDGCESTDTSCDVDDDGSADTLYGDVLRITYEGTQDCLGNSTTAVGGDMPDGVASIVSNVYYLDNQQQLMCLGNGNNIAQPLADGVQDLQILYGEDSDNDKMADRYLPASDANLEMRRVVSIRLAMLAQTEDNVSSSVRILHGFERHYYHPH
ncbi:MAG: PilW family protein [Candidatus Competibacteraceae bacterium]